MASDAVKQTRRGGPLSLSAAKGGTSAVTIGGECALGARAWRCQEHDKCRAPNWIGSPGTGARLLDS